MLNRTMKLLATALVLLVATTIGCGEDDELPDVFTVELIDRSDDEVVGYHYDDHWHGDIDLKADMDESEYESFGFRFLDADDEELDIPLGDDGYGYTLDIDGDEDAVHADTHSDHFHLRGGEEGHVELYFDFERDGALFFDTRGQGFDVWIDAESDNGEHDELQVSEFVLLDRAHDPHEPIADVDDDHWHGEFSDGIELTIADDTDDYETSAVGEGHAVSLGAMVEEEHDDHTDPVDLDGDPYELEVDVTDADYETYLYLDNHGDHVHIVGAEAGHAHVVFQIVHRADDEVVYETPEFDVDVVDE